MTQVPENQHAEDLRQRREALQAQFEKHINPAGDMKMHRVSDGGYAGYGLNQSWMDFQAGHAAGVAAERERCAKACDRVALAWDGEEAPDGGCVAKQCSDAIREGQEKG